MTRPQAGIIPEPGKAALFLVLEVRDAARDGRAVCRQIARVPRVTDAHFFAPWLPVLESRGRI